MNDRQVIREFVQDLLSQKGDLAAFSDNEQLIARGRLQSIDTLEVVVFLEEKYGIDFGEMGFDQNQVESIDNILALIDGKSGLGVFESSANGKEATR
jgi:acyl carrier protein